MSNILNTIKLVEAKRSPEPNYDDPSWDEKVSNVGQKAKQAELLKSKGKEPRTRWNPETKKYYVDFSDQVDEAEEPSALATTGSPLKFIKQSAGKLKPKYKMELINLLKLSLKPKQAAVAETLGTPYPGTYEQTNDMFKSHGAKRTGTLTTESWSQKYKSSINCSHPKGFSQKAHCAGKKKHNESIEMEMTCPDCGMCQTHGDNSKDKLDELKCWSGFHRVAGTKAGFPGSCAKNKTNEEDVTEGLENIGKMSSLVDLPVFGGNGISKVAITGDGRITAVVNVRGVNVPFYISTGEGGKLSVPTGMWYPFFGSGPSGYLNKGTEDSINKFYGSKVFERYASLLNRELGNLMTVQKQIPPMKKEGRSIINKDMSPMEHAEIEANPEEFKKRVNAFLAKIGDKPFYTVNTAKQTDTQGVAEGLAEARGSLFAFVKRHFPTWPDYVLKDFLYAQAKGIRDQAELDDFLKRNKQDFGDCKWTLTKLPITFDIFTPKTQRMLASREGGSSNPFQVPRDAERHALQSQMIQQKGVSAEPIIVAKLSNGYDLIEGWHRTIQHLKAFPQGYTGPAWVCTGATYKSESVKQGVAEGQHSCPHCGGEMVSEELMNEKKDACYYKVKSRYKVWPSAYASGALVKCRNSHGSWGNGSKNESSILEGIERADENLHKWFKEKWVRFGPDGKIRGDCARGDDSEGKPKCLPQSKAQNLGKKGRASAAARKRREDPNPERSGPAINVNTKKK